MATSKKSAGDETFSPQEREAMQAAKSERKKGKKASGEDDLLAKIAEMDKSDRVMAERLHALVKEHAPDLSPKTWYGMPAWANADGKVVCFFTAAGKFDTRYASFGFNEHARLDDGDMWPTAFALTKLTDADAKKLGALLRKAVG
jgi:uncharacterized protein YdhG (YjbR/CyaY superfamily)